MPGISIQENKSLKAFNSFGLDIKARYFTSVTSSDDYRELINHSLFKEQRVLHLGGGSNILFTGDFEGLVIRNEILGMEFVDNNSGKVVLSAGAGEEWHELVMYSLMKGWGGLENLSLIPGKVGAAPIQNIGAYGVELKDVFHSLEGVEIGSGKLVRMKAEDCQFGYRDSVFKHHLKDKVFITRLELSLKKDSEVNTSYGAIKEVLKSWGIRKPTPSDVSSAVIEIRQSKLPNPAEIGNAGSFFKNPVITLDKFRDLKLDWTGLPGYPDREDRVKIPAAYLIEQCGWKGTRSKNIGVHEKQALVIVNYGGGKGSDILNLSREIQASVKEKFDVDLMPEVNII